MAREAEAWKAGLSAKILPCQLCKENLEPQCLVDHLKESHGGVAWVDYYARIVKPWVEAEKAKIEQEVVEWANK